MLTKNRLIQTKMCICHIIIHNPFHCIDIPLVAKLLKTANATTSSMLPSITQAIIINVNRAQR